MNTYGFEVVERRELKEILKEQYRQTAGLVPAREAVALGKLAGVDAMLFGEVVEASAQLAYKQAADGNFIGAHLASAILKLRMVDVESGKVVWNCSLARGSRHYLEEPLVVSNRALARDVNAFSGPLKGATGPERIRAVLDAMGREAAALLPR